MELEEIEKYLEFVTKAVTTKKLDKPKEFFSLYTKVTGKVDDRTCATCVMKNLKSVMEILTTLKDEKTSKKSSKRK